MLKLRILGGWWTKATSEVNWPMWELRRLFHKIYVEQSWFKVWCASSSCNLCVHLFVQGKDIVAAGEGKVRQIEALVAQKDASTAMSYLYNNNSTSHLPTPAPGTSKPKPWETKSAPGLCCSSYSRCCFQKCRCVHGSCRVPGTLKKSISFRKWKDCLLDVQKKSMNF